MKFKFLFAIAIIAGSCNAYAEEPDIVNETKYVGSFAANTTRTTDIGQVGGTVDHDKSCHCWCSAQGILLRECGDDTENLGNYGNIKNCTEKKESHPKCK